MPLPSADTERLWEQLLQFIDEGRVVPVVGQDLLTVRVDGRDVPLYSYLAERLAERLGVDKDIATGDSLNTVVCRYLAKGGQLEDIYPALKTAMPIREQIEPPEPLLKLADIRSLKLFVTTTFDSLLETALNRRRFADKQKTQVLAYSPQAAQDLPCEMQRLNQPTVFHLLGRLSATPFEYAVTDEDILEFIHSLQSEDRRPKLLFDELTSRHLLIIGCAFSDWLARFFIRIAKRDRLSIARGKTDVVADERVRGDAGLVFFLEHFSARTRVFPGGALEFVDELHKRWTAAHPVAEADEGPRGTDFPTELDMDPQSVFLSYASEDLETVRAIRNELDAAGVDVWFDKERLEMGDRWESKIRRNIDNCSFFIPIISRHTLTGERRFFRVEWDQADRVAVRVAPNMRFIVPVAIDDTSEKDEALPDRFRQVQWERLPDGRATADFVGTLKQLVREYQKTVGSVV